MSKSGKEVWPAMDKLNSLYRAHASECEQTHLQVGKQYVAISDDKAIKLEFTVLADGPERGTSVVRIDTESWKHENIRYWARPYFWNSHVGVAFWTPLTIHEPSPDHKEGEDGTGGCCVC